VGSVIEELLNSEGEMFYLSRKRWKENTSRLIVPIPLYLLQRFTARNYLD